jgi:hypothetical protein
MRSQLSLISALHQVDRQVDRTGARFWHSIAHLDREEIDGAILAGWLQLSATRDFVRLTERGKIVAIQHDPDKPYDDQPEEAPHEEPPRT